MSAAVAVRTPWQFGDRAPRNDNGVVLPKVKVVHPNTKLGDINGLNLQGGTTPLSKSKSRQSATSKSSPDAPSPKSSPDPPDSFLPQIPDGISFEVAKDRNKVIIPIFGNARVSSRVENRLTSKNVSDVGKKERLTTSQLEQMIRDKLKSSYLQVKGVFQTVDADGRGKVTRDQLLNVLSQVCWLLIFFDELRRKFGGIEFYKHYDELKI